MQYSTQKTEHYMNNPRQQHYHHTYHHIQHIHHHPHDIPEKILKVVKQSRRAILGNYFAVLVLGSLGFYSVLNAYRNLALSQFGSFFLVTALITLIYSEIKIHYKKLIITNKRAMLNEGILKKSHITIRYSSITEVVSHQRFYQRLLDYGNLIIRTSGIKREQDLQINYVSNPGNIKRILEHFMIGEHKV